MLFSPPVNTFLPWKSTLSWARFAAYRYRPLGCTWTVPAAWRSAVHRLGQRVRAKGDRRIDPAGVHPVGVHLVLGLDRDVHPGLRRMEIEMPRPEVPASVGGDRYPFGQDAVLVVEDLERAGVLSP